MFENIGHGYAIGEQQSKRMQSGEQQFKRTQSGSSSRSGRDRAASSSSSGRNWGAAAGREAEANGEREQQWKRMPQSGPGAAAEADASVEQQLKRTQSGRSSSSESCPAPDYAR